MIQPTFRNLKWGMASSVNVKVDSGQSLSETYHYHPQLELIALYNCRGNAIIGTKVCSLDRDEILLIGKNTPHGFFYRHQNDLHNSSEKPHAVVVQFEENFMGLDFFSIPEAYAIKRLLAAARHGLLIGENRKPLVVDLMKRMLNEYGFKRMLLLLEILHLFDDDGNRKITAGNTGNQSLDVRLEEDGRLQKVWAYTEEHYTRPIKIEDVAFRINLTKESFCRFFKAKTNITYMEYLFSYRIEKAKALILENRMSVKEIAYSCGFLTLSNFYYQFRKIMGCSPLVYQQRLFGELSCHG